jgi:cation:H+ antiporter
LALLVGAFHGSLTRLLGAIFLVGWIVYLVLAYVTEWRRPLPASGTNGAANGAHADYGIGVSVFLIAMGIACLFFAAFLVIDFALLVGRDFHVAPMAIALSAVALGTALPEFSATVGAREHANLASGKLIASSIFNILLVLGIVLLVSPIFVSSSLTGFDLPVMAAAAVLLPLLMLFGWRLTRIQGALLFACYITYLVFVGLHGGVRLPI